MPRYALGLDYGTNSVRALIADTATGEEVGVGVADYPSGEQGIFLDPNDPHLARQHPWDYAVGFYEATQAALRCAGVAPEDIVGIGVDTTGSTPMSVDERGIPLALDPRFEGNLNAMAWLWKDHTAYAEAAEITSLAEERGEPYLAKCGGTYSSEWFWSKVLHCARVAPEVFETAHSWVEAQDMIPAWLCGLPDAASIPRGICAAGHKAMFHDSWGGLPSASFLSELDPRVGALRGRLYQSTHGAGTKAGLLDPEIAANACLAPGTPVSVGAFDAHLGAVGSGVKPGTMVKIMGTSTCDILVGGADTPDIEGVCGVVPGSVIPGMMGIEAGQSAVGDLFNWWVSMFPLPINDGEGLRGKGDVHQEFSDQAARLLPGESGLLALDWNNGNRTVLVDPLLTGLLVGQTLHTKPHEIYRTLIEATAFGSRKIVERIEGAGVRIHEVIVCGGIAEKSPLTMQIYADVLNRPMKIARSSQACALGAAICGAVAGGAHRSVLGGIEAMTGVKELVYVPDPVSVRVYQQLYELYDLLHDAFGVVGTQVDLSVVMKRLLEIRRRSVEC